MTESRYCKGCQSTGFCAAFERCDITLQPLAPLAPPAAPETPAPSDARGCWISMAGGFELETGEIRLAVTDQRDRHCGWVWHVCVEAQYGSETIKQCGGLPDVEAAQAAAEAWVRSFCERTLAGLKPRAVPQAPAEADKEGKA